MAPTNRTYNLGRLSEMEKQERELRISIDAVVKATLTHFEPLDVALTYIDKIDITVINVYSKEMASKLKQLRSLLKEIAQVKAELGDDGP